MLKRFAPISKMEALDDGTIKVWGIASTEAVDSDGEVIKASAMKAALPDYMQWGAIREMHQPIAAGTCLEAGVNDDTGETVICAHVVDEGSIKKVKAGVLKGFSIGGTATATDPLKKTVVTALTLNEISLVDKPANPEAIISLWKADKMSTTANEAPVTGEQVGNTIEELVKGGHMTLGEVLAAVKGAVELKKGKKAMCAHGIEAGAACDKCDGGMAIAKADDGDGDIDEFCKKDYSDDERATMAENGEAEEDGSYPIKNKKDLENAIRAIGRSKDEAKTKKHIKARAKALGLEDELPEDWKETTKAAGAKDGNESGAGKDTEKGTVAPGGGTNAPAGDEETQKAAKTGNGAATLAKAAGGAEVQPVGQGTSGPANAVNQQPAMGVNGTANPQADTPMLQKPKIGDLVTLSWGEDEVGGHIAEIKDLDGGGSEVVVKNGGAHLAVDSSKLVHHELNGDKVHWKVTAADNADFTAAKAAQSARITAALKKAFKAEGTLEKGMWTVSSWANLMQSLVWLMSGLKWEGAMEDDEEDNSLQMRMAAHVRGLGELMLEYAEDELKEIFTGIADPDNIPECVIELAAKPGELLKAVEGRAAPDLGKMLAKAFGAGAAQPDPDVLQKAIKSAVTAAVTAAVGEETAKLEKAHSAQVEELNKRIKELEDQPREMKGVLKGAAINKDSNLVEGGENEVRPVIKNGVEDPVATALKKAHQNPQQFNRLSTQ